MTAKVTFNNMSTSEAELDYSGVFILVAKSFEAELKKRFYFGFMDYLDDKYRKDYKQWPSALLKNKTKKIADHEFTLGSVTKVLSPRRAGNIAESNLDISEKRIVEYCKEKLFHVNNPTDIKDILDRIALDVNKVKERYGNPVAHTKELGITDAQKCFDDVVEVQQMMIKFLKMCKS